MPVPCSTLPLANAVPATHKLLAGTARRWPRIGHHVWHRMHHAVHTAGVNAQLSASTACHLLPGAIASIALGFMPPTSPPAEHPATLAPVEQPAAQSPQGGPLGAIGARIDYADLPWASTRHEAPTEPGPSPAIAPPGSTIITLPYSEALSPASPKPGADRDRTRTDQTPPEVQWPAAGFQPAGAPVQPLPEPSSLAIFALASGGASLIKRRSSARSRVPARDRNA